MTILLLIVCVLLSLSLGVALAMLKLERDLTAELRRELAESSRGRRTLARAVLSSQLKADPKAVLEMLRKNPGMPVREAQKAAGGH